MKIVALITMVALGGRGVQEGESNKSVKQTVTVCMPTEADPRLYLAQVTASKAFAAIGVRLDWRRDQRSCPHTAISISLAAGPRPDFHVGALGFALPYEGRHIQVFYDRVRARSEAHRTPFVLGYVLVHEITHILQGFERHSETGIMKASWEANDYHHMASLRLAFTEEDVTLIHLGLTTRSSRMAPDPEGR